MIHFFRKKSKLITQIINCFFGNHHLDCNSVFWDGSHYYGICISCQCLMRRRSKKVWKRWPSFAANSPDALGQLANEGASTRVRVEAEKALKRNAVRAQTIAKLSSLESGAIQDNQ